MAAGKAYANISEGRNIPGFLLRDSGPEDASQTFKIGSPVVADAADNYIREYVIGTDTVILGFAESAGHNDATAGTSRVSYLVAKPGTIVQGTLEQALAATTKNTKVGLVKDATTGICYWSTGAAVKQGIVRGWSSRWAVGDTRALVEVELLDAYDTGSE